MAIIKGVCLLCLKKGVLRQAFNGHAKTVFEVTIVSLTVHVICSQLCLVRRN